MTYQNKFVVAVKSNNSILREHDGTVTLPFGSEYSLLLKNLNSNDSLVKISIDNNDVLDGRGLIIQGNCEKELLGFIKNRQVTNRFKFIRKTEEIVKHRGDKIDDGLIRIEFQFVKEVHEVVTKHKTYHAPYYEPWYYPWERKPWRPHETWTIWEYGSSSEIPTGGAIDSSGLTSGVIDGSSLDTSNTINCFSSQVSNLSVPIQDEGITVHGSQAHQQLQPAHINDLESQSHIIIIKLRGVDSGGIEIVEPITVKTKLKCPTCGKKNKSYNEFCGKCGTCLY